MIERHDAVHDQFPDVVRKHTYDCFAVYLYVALCVCVVCVCAPRIFFREHDETENGNLHLDRIVIAVVTTDLSLSH